MIFGTLIPPVSKSRVTQIDWHICITEFNFKKKKGNNMPHLLYLLHINVEFCFTLKVLKSNMKKKIQ